jgi:hypothetical protein
MTRQLLQSSFTVSVQQKSAISFLLTQMFLSGVSNEISKRYSQERLGTEREYHECKVINNLWE